jgi:hypothetical protein
LLLAYAPLLFALLTDAHLLARAGPRALLEGIPAVLFLVAFIGFLGFITLRRYVYWRVDQEGIHQRCLGMPIWHLPWAEIASRELGTAHNTWIRFWRVPVVGGPYQILLLKDGRGRIRKVNRMAKNGDQLDALVRLHLDPREEADLAARHSRAVDTATGIHRRKSSTVSPLYLINQDSPVVRMKINEPLFVDACCNCLGPVARRVEIPMSPGLLGHLDPGYEGLPIPFCSECLDRTRTRAQGPARALLIGFLIFVAAGVLITVCTTGDMRKDERPQMLLIGGTGLALVGFVFWWSWKRIRCPAHDRLVKVLRLNGRQGWIEVQFGNPEYARLVADLLSAGPRMPQ